MVNKKIDDNKKKKPTEMESFFKRFTRPNKLIKNTPGKIPITKDDGRVLILNFSDMFQTDEIVESLFRKPMLFRGQLIIRRFKHRLLSGDTLKGLEEHYMNQYEKLKAKRFLKIHRINQIIDLHISAVPKQMSMMESEEFSEEDFDRDSMEFGFNEVSDRYHSYVLPESGEDDFILTEAQLEEFFDSSKFVSDTNFIFDIKPFFDIISELKLFPARNYQYHIFKSIYRSITSHFDKVIIVTDIINMKSIQNDMFVKFRNKPLKSRPFNQRLMKDIFHDKDTFGEHEILIPTRDYTFFIHTNFAEMRDIIDPKRNLYFKRRDFILFKRKLSLLEEINKTLERPVDTSKSITAETEIDLEKIKEKSDKIAIKQMTKEGISGSISTTDNDIELTDLDKEVDTIDKTEIIDSEASQNKELSSKPPVSINISKEYDEMLASHKELTHEEEDEMKETGNDVPIKSLIINGKEVSLEEAKKYKNGKDPLNSKIDGFNFKDKIPLDKISNPNAHKHSVDYNKFIREADMIRLIENTVKVHNASNIVIDKLEFEDVSNPRDDLTKVSISFNIEKKGEKMRNKIFFNIPKISNASLYKKNGVLNKLINTQVEAILMLTDTGSGNARYVKFNNMYQKLIFNSTATTTSEFMKSVKSSLDKPSPIVHERETYQCRVPFELYKMNNVFDKLDIYGSEVLSFKDKDIVIYSNRDLLRREFLELHGNKKTFLYHQITESKDYVMGIIKSSKELLLLDKDNMVMILDNKGNTRELKAKGSSNDNSRLSVFDLFSLLGKQSSSEIKHGGIVNVNKINSAYAYVEYNGSFKIPLIMLLLTQYDFDYVLAYVAKRDGGVHIINKNDKKQFGSGDENPGDYIEIEFEDVVVYVRNNATNRLLFSPIRKYSATYMKSDFGKQSETVNGIFLNDMNLSFRAYTGLCSIATYSTDHVTKELFYEQHYVQDVYELYPERKLRNESLSELFNMSAGLKESKKSHTDYINSIVKPEQVKFIDIVYEATILLTMNNIPEINDMKFYRIKSGGETVNNMIYKRLCRVLDNFNSKNTRLNSRDLDFSPNQIVNDVGDHTNSNPYHNLSLYSELDETLSVTYADQGFGGLKSTKYASKKSRGMHKTMENVHCVITPDNPSVGLKRLLTHNNNIYNIRGIVNTKKHSEESTNQFSSLAMLAIPHIRHSDAPRSVMGSKQAAGSIVTGGYEVPFYITGIELMIGEMVDSIRCFKAEKPGYIETLDDKFAVLFYEDGTHTSISLDDVVTKVQDDETYSRNDLVPMKHLRKGYKFKEDELLFYNPNFFKETIGQNVMMKVGMYVPIAYMSATETFEDGLLTSESMNILSTSKTVSKVPLSLNVSSIIEKSMMIGDDVEFGSELCKFQTDGFSGDFNMTNSHIFDEIGDETKESSYYGKLVDIIIVFNQPLGEFSPSVQKFVNKVIKYKNGLIKKDSTLNAQSGDINQPDYITTDTYKSFKFADMAIIYLIEETNIMRPGDKCTNISTKGLSSGTINKSGGTFFSDRNIIKGELSQEVYLVIDPLSIINRKVSNTMIDAYMNKLFTQMHRDILDDLTK